VCSCTVHVHVHVHIYIMCIGDPLPQVVPQNSANHITFIHVHVYVCTCMYVYGTCDLEAQARESCQ
jgi:hypothetical protein